MPTNKLTLKSVDVRAVLLPLKRPVVSKVGLFDQWPMVLIDLYTHEGIVGRSYLEPYLKQSVKYIVPAIRDLAEAARDKPIAPFDAFRAGRASLGLVGLEGMSLIAIAGLDMAVWDALAKAADLPLVRLLGGSPAPVQAYNSNGLWLIAIDKLGREAADLVAEGGFKGLKLRLGRDRLADDIEAIRVVREAVGAAGIEMSTHLYPEVSAHLMQVTETAHWLEWQDWADPILAETFKLEAGHLIIPDRPGSGITWNEEAIKRHRLDA